VYNAWKVETAVRRKNGRRCISRLQTLQDNETGRKAGYKALDHPKEMADGGWMI
jgi:hypothetical protein